LEVYTGIGTQKQIEWCPYQLVQNCDDLCIRLDTMVQCDSWTDRQKRQISMLTRDKNCSLSSLC